MPTAIYDKQTVLVIDHDKMSAKTIERVLKSDMGFNKVIIASDGKIGLKAIQAGGMDWVLAEWDVPSVSGYELVKELRGNPLTMDVPFLMLSGRVDRKALLEAISLGVTDFIAKPFTPGTVAAKIKRVALLREKRVASRVVPTETFPVSITMQGGGAKFKGVIGNISATGMLVSSDRLKGEGINIFDQAELKIRIAKGVVAKAIGAVVRMECDYNPDFEPESHILCAFDFKKVDSENKVLINRFINEQRSLSMAEQPVIKGV